jgi:thiol:disulfide interchange protein
LPRAAGAPKAHIAVGRIAKIGYNSILARKGNLAQIEGGVNMCKSWLVKKIVIAAVILAATVSSAGAQIFKPRDSSKASGGEAGPVKLSGEFTVAPGSTAGQLSVTAKIDPGWHIYSITQAPDGPTITQIKPDPSAQYRLSGPFKSVEAPDKAKEPDAFGDLVLETHQGQVTWRAPIELAAGVDPATLQITGAVFAQACQATNCRMPQDYKFVATFQTGHVFYQTSAGYSAESRAVIVAPATGATAQPTTPMEMENALAPFDFRALAVQLGLAFLGGLILNVMPCVLPVISLKLLSFMEQAHESRGRVFALNLWYCLGLMSVFMVLAVLAVTANLAWGEQFTLPWFKVAMTGLVFVMALSFLGVWEIPIPGFVGSGRSGQLQAKEGASGAFFKGAFTTVLATPCSGPFLGSVFFYLLTQPPAVTYCVFAAMGFGMASPYLVIGMFPGCLRFLPRPGAWMETVQQVMAFLLLGTVVFLFSQLNAYYFIPTLTLLIGLWFAAWLIGRTPLTVGPQGRAVAWGASIVVATAVGVFAFTVLLHEPIIAWKPFSASALQTARSEGKTVMVDFSANWCLTCKRNLRFAVDTNAVEKVVKRNRVVPMLADWTDRSDTIKKSLNELGCNSIPVLAIWPPDGPQSRPIILRDWLNESDVIGALDKAGPSK